MQVAFSSLALYNEAKLSHYNLNIDFKVFLSYLAYYYFNMKGEKMKIHLGHGFEILECEAQVQKKYSWTLFNVGFGTQPCVPYLENTRGSCFHKALSVKWTLRGLKISREYCCCQLQWTGVM